MAIKKSLPPQAADLSDDQLLTLISGKDFWRSEDLPDFNIPSIRMSDGPHGLRYQPDEADHLGINESAKATAFPTASASANSWNPELLKKMGQAIGEEARSLNVDVVLGPGVNIKRNPLGGRNFEYFSEDPYLAGTLAAAWINGLQEKGAGASLKHFAGNNQEADRLLSDSLIDQTALHELYLEAFRIAVTNSQPETVMNSYNKVNGTYMSENKYLMNSVLRGQWGFKGMVVTDWGGMNNPVASVNAGTDLEMPGNEHFFKPELVKGIKSGEVEKPALLRAGEKIINVATKDRPEFSGNRDDLLAQNALLAQQIAEESIVLLKNDHQVLPLKDNQDILLIGAMANDTRYQGAGSSHINPLNHISIKDGLEEAGVTVHFEPGYSFDEPAKALQDSAVEAAKEYSQVVIVVGLPDSAESEGFDRESLALPTNQNDLIKAISAINDNVTVLVVAGAPVELPWRDQVAGLLALYLNGQNVGAAAAKIMLGEVNPSGHLAESYPISYQDVPSSGLFGVNPRSVPYVESLYVGYRYYDKANVPVAYPFGFGLSYTDFSYSDIKVDQTEISQQTKEVTVTLSVTNTGKVAGATVVQIYVGDQDQVKLIPKKVLKAFQKVYLAPGESKEVEILIQQHAFKHWQDNAQSFALENGAAKIFVATSVADVLADFDVQTVGIDPVQKDIPDWYKNPIGLPNEAEFTALSGLIVAPIPTFKPGEMTPMNTPRELSKYSNVVNKVTQIMLKQKLDEAGNAPDSPESDFLEKIILDTPLVRLAQQSSGILKPWHVKMLVTLANRPIRTALFSRGGK